MARNYTGPDSAAAAPDRNLIQPESKECKMREILQRISRKTQAGVRNIPCKDVLDAVFSQP